MPKNLTVKESLQNLATILDLVDSDWFAVEHNKILGNACLLLIIKTTGIDNPIILTAIMLNMLKSHVDYGKSCFEDVNQG